jgi:hypothetical protein
MTIYAYRELHYWQCLDPKDVTVPQFIEGNAKGTMRRKGKYVLKKTNKSARSMNEGSILIHGLGVGPKDWTLRDGIWVPL